MPTNVRSDLDLRVASGLKVMLTGEAALSMTHDQVRASGWLGRARCSCGHRAFLDHARFIREGRGGETLSMMVGRLACAECKGGSVVIEVVDPWRCALDP